ncbi:deoxyguanosinetriphosphate triphosphohydrolase family protein [Aestuariibacter sp. GS-14]|uniref:anti-phage deoxyguanosine triphosphatase n=1 Tax=Aestuariibacter sp. GS-14 TaxID=2590670 RepID=UPI00112B8EC9|nr:anti-phage deoxyguanosine triphosphatase [Aestuariibacter sp. GS-14]TPV59812.1 deoxyguanosinetriphosphate triphosphohydrolase family protein [Aestuariibacter sp. GS-14]
MQQPGSTLTDNDDWQSTWWERRLPRTQARDGDHRSPFQRDKARVLHSAAFRRLQAKTQVLGVGLSDFYRTRLTHSLEAAQIGTGITAQLQGKFPRLTEHVGLDPYLIETLCLAHDIGHPPFGHGGEIALNYMMHEHGGFEGNGQTFRIVNQLEPYTADHGMNLSRRSVLGLVKYPNFIDTLTNHAILPSPSVSLRQVKAEQWHPPKGLFRCDESLFEWLIAPFSQQDKDRLMSFDTATGKHGKTRHKSFDCSVMELADDIAYGIHDLEDAIVMGMVKRAEFVEELQQSLEQLQVPWLSEHIAGIGTRLFSQAQHERKNAIGALVNCFITAIRIEEDSTFDHPLLRYQAVLPEHHHNALGLFKQFVYTKVIRKPEVQLLEYKGQQVVMELFEAFSADPTRLLPENTRKRWLAAEERNNGHRVIADYISGMTDEFAARLYSNMFVPKRGGILDTLSL